VTWAPWWQQWDLLILAFALAAGSAAADELLSVAEAMPNAPQDSAQYIASLMQLQRLNTHQLEQLFALGEVPPLPVEYVRGQVLFLSESLPRVGAWASGLVWKGKHIDADGGFINQWLGFRALHSHVAYGPSCYDGRPSLVLEYPAGTPLFANMRDEVREIAPGLYLSRVYQRHPCRFRGYLGLQLEPEKRHKHR
jgi:hypothetical protein